MHAGWEDVVEGRARSGKRAMLLFIVSAHTLPVYQDMDYRLVQQNFLGEVNIRGLRPHQECKPMKQLVQLPLEDA